MSLAGVLFIKENGAGSNNYLQAKPVNSLSWIIRIKSTGYSLEPYYCPSIQFMLKFL